jgi:putative ABC transport system permease protein
MKEQGRSVSGERRFGLGNLLVITQVALSLILVVAAGLFVRTFSSLARLDLGFDRDKVLVASVNAQRLQLEPSQRPDLYHRLRTATAAVPGIEVAAASVVTPVGGSTWQFAIDKMDGVELSKEPGARRVWVNVISPGWFKTYGTRIIAGRDFADADTAGSAPVIIVNEAFARKFTGGKNPIGHRIGEMGSPSRPEVEREIVGYVEEAVYISLREPAPPTMYIPIPQQPEPPPSINISVRASTGSPALLTRSLASALTSVNRDLAITFRPLADQVNAALVQERIVAILSGFFGALALLLAGIGLYGITSYTVSRRRSEIGVRMALGAAPAGVVQMVLLRVVMLVGIGVATGAAVSLWASRFVSTLLYGLQPRDPSTLVFAAVVLASIGALAGLVPALRASRIDPARVLREG